MRTVTPFRSVHPLDIDPGRAGASPQSRATSPPIGTLETVSISLLKFSFPVPIFILDLPLIISYTILIKKNV